MTHPLPHDRIAALDPAVLEVLQAVAALGRAAVRDAAAVLGVRTEHLAAAVRAGVLVLDDGSLRPVDPELGAAALAGLADADRRALHARLAASSVTDADALRQRDLATPDGIHEELAAALERVAARAELAGLVEDALEFWGRSAARSEPDSASRNRRELRLAEQAHLEGRFGTAGAILEALHWASLTGDQAECAVDLLTSTMYRTAGLLAARLRIEGILAALPADSPHREVLGVYLAGIGEHFGESRQRLEEALPRLRSGRFSARFRYSAMTKLLYAKMMNGAGLDAELLEELRVLELQLPGILLEDTAAAKTAMYAHVVDDAATSGRAIAGLMVRADAAGDVGFRETLLIHAAHVDLLLGRFGAAAHRLEQNAALRPHAPASPAKVRAAGLLALELGDHDEVVRVVGRAESAGIPPMGQIARSALQGILLARTGTPSSAIRHLQDAVMTAERSGIREPGRRLWVDVDLARAFVQTGDIDRAAAIAASLRRLAERTARRLPALQAERIEAWLADAQDRPHDRRDRVLSVLAAAETMQWVPERARLTTEALAMLQRTTLDERTRSEVMRSARAALALLEDGVARRALAHDLERWEQAGLQVLTPGERRVAESVAAGMSNKDVAAALHLSPRTVESHLRNVFLKLEVTSRSQLVAWFARARA